MTARDFLSHENDGAAGVGKRGAKPEHDGVEAGELSWLLRGCFQSPSPLPIPREDCILL